MGGVLGIDAISLKVRNNSAAPPNKSARKWVIYARQSGNDSRRPDNDSRQPDNDKRQLGNEARQLDNDSRQLVFRSSSLF
ncbi:MAG: hypothetical protein LBJ67_01280 [Planctomycetaceae bacterium]|nr:hypothetical protein [Planctomycetaceae bacterium]